MAKKQSNKIAYKQFLGTIFFCVTLLVYSTCFMLENGGITYVSVTGAFVNVLPYCIAVGFLGYVTGLILDKPKKVKPKYDRNALEKLVGELSPTDKISQSLEPSTSTPMGGIEPLGELDIKVDTEADS